MKRDVSVVIPTCRRPDLLKRCLMALKQQELASERFEVIVADDGADESTKQIVEEAAHDARPKIRYLPVTGQHGPAAARNVGWRAAVADAIAFTDDDCLPDRGWLTAGLAALGRGADAVAGAIVMPLPPDPTDYERDAAGLTTGEFVTANCFCRRTALEHIGGFDERFTSAWREDSDLQFTLLEHGFVIDRAPQAIVVHPVRPAPWGVSLTQQRKTQFNALLFKKHPALYRQRLALFPRDYYLIDAALAIAIGLGLARRPWAALFAASIWAGATGYLCARRLRDTSREPSHVAEMVVTSILVPPLSLFWHARGMWRFKTFFA
jgi:glycosyltransferase involved in cell wall biosynthesis